MEEIAPMINALLNINYFLINNELRQNQVLPSINIDKDFLDCRVFL